MNEKKFDNFIVVVTIMFTGSMLFHNYSTKRLIFLNPYIPFLVYFAGSAFGIVIIYLIRRVFFKIKESIAIFFTDFIILVKSIFLSVLVFGSSFSWIFDYINMKSVYSSEMIYMKCKVYRIQLSSASGTHNSISFLFLGKDKSISNFSSTDAMRIAYKAGNCNGCYLNLSFKKGLLTSYIIEDFDFIVQ